MDYKEYISIISTYRPVQLREDEERILYFLIRGDIEKSYELEKKNNSLYYQVEETINNNKNIVYYSIFALCRKLRDNHEGLSYKNVHKKVKRLLKLKLIEEVEGKFGHRAKYYKATPYGLICFFNEGPQLMNVYLFLNNNLDNIVIKTLLLQLFEPFTLSEIIYSFKRWPGELIAEYLYECCKITTLCCKSFWHTVNDNQLFGIELPEDNKIHEYLRYLDGKEIDSSLLSEISQYKEKITPKIQEYREEYHPIVKRGISTIPENHNFNINTGIEDLPFPLNFPRYELKERLEYNAKILIFKLMREIGKELIHNTLYYKNEDDDANMEDYHEYMILNDKRFIKAARLVKKEIDDGWRIIKESS